MVITNMMIVIEKQWNYNDEYISGHDISLYLYQGVDQYTYLK